MNIEEMQKLWNEQEQKTYYVIDEDKVFAQIKKKAEKLNRAVNRDEIGLIIISIATIIIMYFTKLHNVFTFLTMGILVVIGLMVFFSRRKRLKDIASYQENVKDHIDEAIQLTRYRIRRARTFIWWYILPLAIPTLGNMYIGNTKTWWQWVMIIGAFILSYVVVRHGLKRQFEPGLERLKKLRMKLELTE